MSAPSCFLRDRGRLTISGRIHPPPESSAPCRCRLVRSILSVCLRSARISLGPLLWSSVCVYPVASGIRRRARSSFRAECAAHRLRTVHICALRHSEAAMSAHCQCKGCALTAARLTAKTCPAQKPVPRSYQSLFLSS